MASSQQKDAHQLLLDMKVAARDVTNLLQELSIIATKYAALGIKYDGTIAGTTADPEAIAGVAALNAVYQTIVTNQVAILRLSDIGNNVA